MLVTPSFIHAYLDTNKSMFDFNVNFFIVNPRNSSQQAAYTFDKNSTKKELRLEAAIDKQEDNKKFDQSEFYPGADAQDVNDGRAFKWNTMAGPNGNLNDTAKAACTWHTTNKDGTFTVSVRPIQKDIIHNVLHVSFKGKPPAWLTGGAIHHGSLKLFELKDFNNP